MSQVRSQGIGALFFIAAFSVATASAEQWPLYPIRELVIQSPVIVVAKPVAAKIADTEDYEAVAQFLVERVVRGPEIQAGQTIDVRRVSMYAWHRRAPSESAIRGARPHRIDRVLLFLAHATKSPGSKSMFDLCPSGVRCLTDMGAVLGPNLLVNSGPYFLARDDRPDWNGILARIEHEIPLVNEVQALQAIENPVVRNQAILAWIRAHKSEFVGDAFRSTELAKPGWCSLERSMFVKVLDTHRPHDAWEAAVLYHELNPKHFWLPTDGAIFGSRAARDLLLGVAIDEKQRVPDRAMALYQLRYSAWPGKWERTQDYVVEPVERDEQRRMIHTVVPLLKSPDEVIRLHTAQLLHWASRPDLSSEESDFVSDALSPLMNAYRREPQGKVRHAVADALSDLCSADEWARLSGNPFNTDARIEECTPWHDAGPGEVFLRFYYASNRAYYKPPVMILDRIASDGQVVERRTIAFDKPLPERWDMMARRKQHEIAQILQTTELAAGRWRIVVEGLSGGENEFKWRSDPYSLEVRLAK